MGRVGPYLRERLEYFLKDNKNKYFIISGTDLSGKNTFAYELADVIKETTGHECCVFDFLDNPPGKLTRFSLDRNMDGKMARVTQIAGMFGSHVWTRVFNYYPAKRMDKVILQVRGSPYDMATLSDKSMNSQSGYFLLNLVSRLTNSAIKISLVGDGETLFRRALEDSERRRKAIQRYETPEEIDRVSGSIVNIQELLEKLGYIGLPDIIYDTTEKDGKCAIVSEKKNERKKQRKRDILNVRGAIAALRRRGKHVPSILEEIVEKCEGEELMDRVSEYVDESIKEKKNNDV